MTSSSAAPAQNQESAENALSENDAIALALRNNTAFQALLADLDLAWGDRVQAGSLPNPTLSMLLPAGPKALELTARLPLEFLWLRPKRKTIAELEYQRTIERLTQGGLDLIRDVQVACTDFAWAEQRLPIANELADVNASIARLTEARLHAGDISELESSAAKLEALRARELRARAVHERNMAQERLRYLVGAKAAPRFKLKPMGLETQAVTRETTEQWITMALASRPDLRAAELGVKAAGKGVDLAQVELFTASAGINAKDVNNIFRAGPTLDLPIPLLNQNQGGMTLAEARLKRAARTLVALRDRVTNEISEASIRLALAQDGAREWSGQILPALQATAGRAEQARLAGDLSELAVLESTRALSDARLQALQAGANVRRAVAELERCVGLHLPALNPGSNPTPHESN